ncbi:hypothetical protein V1508DRAFT_232431 [Lipomyces doorenjongii]|uniref:uncharacterized protein n=1 Tax=Lipomyces doorenjongii TaxID=383834 RepID=UPI0034CF9C39
MQKKCIIQKMDWRISFTQKDKVAPFTRIDCLIDSGNITFSRGIISATIISQGSSALRIPESRLQNPCGSLSDAATLLPELPLLHPPQACSIEIGICLRESDLYNNSIGIIGLGVLKYNQSIRLPIRSVARVIDRCGSNPSYSRCNVIAYASVLQHSYDFAHHSVAARGFMEICGKANNCLSPVIKQNKFSLSVGRFSLLNDFLVTVVGDYELEHRVTW